MQKLSNPLSIRHEEFAHRRSLSRSRTLLDPLRVEGRRAYLFVFVNGRPLTKLQVDLRVSDGEIYLPSGVTESDIRLMNRDWKLIGGRKKR